MRAPISTNPSIFLRLQQSDPAPREFAWNESHLRCAPIIACFAQRLGARPQDVDDVVQDVMLGFCSKAPTFIYDPSKGRFRGYLKVCTYHALTANFGKQVRFQGVPLDQQDPEAFSVDQVWNDRWQQELLERALNQVRDEMAHTRTFQDFERYVAFNQPAQAVAENLGLHITTVYRAKEQITRLLREKVRAMNDDD